MSTTPPSTTDAQIGELQGNCYGFHVRSSLPFTYLRQGGTDDVLDVVELELRVTPTADPVMEWLPREDRELHARIYADGDRYHLWTDREGWFSIDPPGRAITVPPVPDPIRLEERLWGFPALLCYLARGELPLHAAAVDVGGSAILFAAPGHFGKTTLAAAFHMAGHRVLADDISCCRLEPVPSILPGPSVLRMRRDSYERLDPSGAEITADHPGRVHLALNAERRGDGAPVPLRGIVFLRTGEPVRTQVVATGRSLPDLWALSLKLPSDADRARCFQATAALAGSVPVWNLYRPLEFEGLPRIVERVIDTCLET
jgi:hypothetical protein